MSHRLDRVKSQIERILGEIFVKEGPSFGIGLISINDIVISRDLSHAKVWVSFIGEQNQSAAFDRLVSNARTIQTLLYQKLSIKKVPKISWQIDEDPDRSHRIEGILDDIRRSQGQNPEV